MLQWICQEEEVDHLSNSRITKLRAHPIPHNVRQRTNLLGDCKYIHYCC